MARNIEIKAIIDDRETIYNKIKKISTSGPNLLIQKDIFYNSPFGRLKLREINGTNLEIIFYIRKNQKSPKTSKYYRIKVNKASIIDKLLRILLGIKGIVKKKREVFFVDRTRIHIDSVDSLGEFIELEVMLQMNENHYNGFAVANDLINYLEIHNNSLIEKSYLELMNSS